MFWVPKEQSQLEGSFENPKHMFKLIDKKKTHFTRQKFAYQDRHIPSLSVEASLSILFSMYSKRPAKISARFKMASLLLSMISAPLMWVSDVCSTSPARESITNWQLCISSSLVLGARIIPVKEKKQMHQSLWNITGPAVVTGGITCGLTRVTSSQDRLSCENWAQKLLFFEESNQPIKSHVLENYV